jgi:alkylation response protein AidB-like acyl-CoA dehydrogenase
MFQGLRFTRPENSGQYEPLRDEVRAFLKAERDAGTYRPTGEFGGGFSFDFSKKVGDRGWIGMTWPKQYGGQDRGFAERYVVSEEMLAAGAPVRAHWTADRQSGPLLLRYGTEEQKKAILPRICQGEVCFCIGLSEPNSGSDLFSVQTKAVRTDDGWRINGQKIWTSNAHRAHYMVALLRTSPPSEDNRRFGLTQFLVDMKTPGITVRPIINITGQHDFNDVFFDDVLLPPEAAMGEVDQAWKQASAELAYERSGPERFLSTYLLLEELVRCHEGANDARVNEGIGRLVAQLWTLRQMSLSVAGMLQAGETPAIEASLVKDIGTNFEKHVPEVARLLRPPKSSKGRARFESVLALATALAPALTIRGGTQEILRGIIARGLGLR